MQISVRFHQIVVYFSLLSSILVKLNVFNQVIQDKNPPHEFIDRRKVGKTMPNLGRLRDRKQNHSKPYSRPKPYLETIEIILDLFADTGMLPFLLYGDHWKSLWNWHVSVFKPYANRTRTAADTRYPDSLLHCVLQVSPPNRSIPGMVSSAFLRCANPGSLRSKPQRYTTQLQASCNPYPARHNYYTRNSKIEKCKCILRIFWGYFNLRSFF